jgi:hypothetical protein
VHGGVDHRVALAEVCLFAWLAESDGHPGDGTTRPDGLQSVAGAPSGRSTCWLVYRTLAGAP